MLRIYEAAISENGTAFGVEGNQLRTKGLMDGELRVRDYDKDEHWDGVFRLKDARRIPDVVALAKSIVGNELVGYSQGGTRASMYWELVRYGEIKHPVNCDCSSFVEGVLAYLGFDVTYNATTADMPYDLPSSGEVYRINPKDELESGDILWRIGHTAFLIDDDPYPDIPTEEYEICNCAVCCLREGQSTDYGIISYLVSGQHVGLISFADNGWGQVKFEGIVGYVSPKFLRKAEKEPELVTEPYKVWNCAYCNLRDFPKDGNVMTCLAAGEDVDLISFDDKTGWGQVRYKDLIGYVSPKYLVRRKA